MKHARFSLWFLFLGVLGCSSTGVGNPGATETVTLALLNDPNAEPEPTDTGEQLDSANLRHAALVFGEIHFLPCDATDSIVVTKGPFTVDLAQNSVEPAIPSVPIVDSGYCGIDAILAPALSPPSLAGRSMFFSGVRTDGTLFLLFADMPGILRLRPRSATQVWPEDGAHDWLWAMRPKRWLLPAELDAESPAVLFGVDNVIAIDVNRYPILFEKIRERLARRSTLHVDLNDNHHLDDDERTGQAYIGRGLDSLD